MASLTIREPGRVPVRVEVENGMVLGRDASCDVVLTHRSVSRRHAQLIDDGEGLRIIDLGSTLGIQMDGTAVTDERFPPGAAARLGSVLVELVDDAAAGEEVTPHPWVTDPRTPEGRRLDILFALARGASDELVERVLHGIIDAFRCERGVVELRRPDGHGSKRIARGSEVVVSRAVQRALLERREPVLVHHDVRSGAIGAAMGVPLASGERFLGFIYVEDRTRAARYSTAELDFLTAVAQLLAASLAEARERERLQRLVEAAPRESDELGGESEPMRRLMRDIQRLAAARDTAVLIRGEWGSGKSRVARRLHALSPRAGGPFVAVACAAGDAALESRIALADGGTLFLDSVSDLSPAGQAKVLHLLGEDEVAPAGVERAVTVDVRVIASAHASLEAEVGAGRFREDLYYRLAVGKLQVPPLRERGEDVVLLANRFRERFGAQLGRGITGFGPRALAALRACRWPGNVRQLRNEVERAVIHTEGEIIEELDLPGVVLP